MTYNETMELVGFLNRRFAKAGMTPWYLWAVNLTWEKLDRWAKMLGYKEA